MSGGVTSILDSQESQNFHNPSDSFLGVLVACLDILEGPPADLSTHRIDLLEQLRRQFGWFLSHAEAFAIMFTCDVTLEEAEDALKTFQNDTVCVNQRVSLHQKPGVHFY